MNKIKTNDAFLCKIAVLAIIFWIIFQIILIASFCGAEQRSDMGAYISMAQRCFDSGQYYPMPQDIYSDYIWAPGFINYLILQIHIFNTTDFNPIMNLFLNIAIMIMIYYLSIKFFSKLTGLISVIIFCLLISNSLTVIGAYTEIPFMFLCLGALCLVFSRKWQFIILAAMLFAVANWIRPLVIIFLFSLLIYFIFTKVKFYNYFALFIPYMLILFTLGTISEKKIGHFVYQSTTSGFNLLMTANDNTKGTYMSAEEHFIENKESLNFVERDSVWQSRSFEWIKENPMKFTALYFLKIPLLYIHDIWGYMSHIDLSKISPVKKYAIKFLLSIPYYFTFIFFFYAVWTNRKNLFTEKSIFLVIFFTGTLASAVYPVEVRYHYPFMFAVIIYAAYGFNTFIERRLHKN